MVAPRVPTLLLLLACGFIGAPGHDTPARPPPSPASREAPGQRFSAPVASTAAASWTTPGASASAPGLLEAVQRVLAADAPASYAPVVDAGRSGALRAANPAQHFVTTFDQDGLTIAPAAGDAVSPALHLQTMADDPTGTVPVLAHDGRVEYRRLGMTEWYVNGPLGLEQGFDVLAPPAGTSGEAVLTLAIAIGAPWTVRVRDDGRGATLTAPGRAALRYGDVHAWDARGRELVARVEPRAAGLALAIDVATAVYPVTVDPVIQEEAKLTATDGAVADYFGFSVAVNGDTAIVGAYRADVGGVGDQGAAYVFVWSSGVWTQQAKLTASDGAAADYFGYSVALSGDTTVVGAYQADIGGVSNVGAAYVFVRSSAVWTQQAKLTASDGAANDDFGWSVAVGGDTAVVGAYHADVSGASNAGAAYVFVRSSGSWTQQTKLTASDGTAIDFFGQSVAVSGDTAVIGASGADAAYVFVRSSGTWTQQTKLTASDGTGGDNFGQSVALSSDTAVVGAPEADVSGLSARGAAYAFVRSSGTWTQQGKLTASDGAAGDRFGHSVALKGEAAVMGAYGADVSQADQGAAYLFTRSSSVWTEQAKLTASDGAASDNFGIGKLAMGIDGATVVAGARNADGSQGAAYAYRFTAPAVTAQPANQTVGVGLTANFTVTASGSPSPSYQWQVSADGGSTWTDVTNTSPYSGATTATLTVTATASRNGYQYRCVATNYLGAATSSGATMTNRPSDARMALDAPANGASPGLSFTIAGWAADLGAGAGPGVDAIHVYAYPVVNGAFGSAQFVGQATYGNGRGDVGAVFGSQFTNVGYSLTASSLSAGSYRLIVYARSTVSGTFNNERFADITVTAPVSNPAMAMDIPSQGATPGLSFTVAGWAVDRGAPSGTGVDAVHVYAYPIIGGGFGAAVWVGAPAYGSGRADVGAVFGSQFTNVGFSLPATLPLGRYRVIAYARSTVTGTFNSSRSADITIASKPEMALDGPANNATVVQPFNTGGWAVDRAASSGAGVDAIHVWAFPTDGSPARFVDAATLGGYRPDVGAVFGSQFNNAGYNFLMTSLTPGSTYDLGVYAHSTVTGTFNQQRFVRVTVAASGSGSIAASDLSGLSESIEAYSPIVDPPPTGSVIQMSVDVPQAGNLRSGPLVVAGWALDPEAATDSGIGGIHVWAVRREAAAPAVFLGVAESGVSRPDVGAAFGAQFDHAGWQLVTPTLAPGEYDLLIYAWNARTGRFEAVRVVRVMMQ